LRGIREVLDDNRLADDVGLVLGHETKESALHSYPAPLLRQGVDIGLARFACLEERDEVVKLALPIVAAEHQSAMRIRRRWTILVQYLEALAGCRKPIVPFAGLARHECQRVVAEVTKDPGIDRDAPLAAFLVDDLAW